MSFADKQAAMLNAVGWVRPEPDGRKGISENMNWKKTVTTHDSRAEFAPPSDEVTIAEAEKALNLEFPSDLRSFFLEAGGLVADYGCEVIWKISDIVNRNKEFRGTATRLFDPKRGDEKWLYPPCYPWDVRYQAGRTRTAHGFRLR